MRDLHLRLSNVIFVAVMLSMFIVAYIFGVYRPRQMEQQIKLTQEIQVLAVDLAVAIANKDAESFNYELVTIKRDGNTYPESITPDWSGNVVHLSIDLVGGSSKDYLRESFLKTFVETYNGKMLANQERKKRKGVQEPM